MNKYILLLFFLLLIVTAPIQAKHLHAESQYQQGHCAIVHGELEHQNKDFTRVDCLTSQHAIEYDFAKKWAECTGQAEHYALMTGKKGKCVLILENPQKEMIYFNRVKKLSEIHNFDVEFITPDIFKK